MTKNLLLTLTMSLLVASMGFTSCKEKSNAMLSAADSILLKTVSKPDTVAAPVKIADSSWEKAAETYAAPTAMPEDSIRNKEQKKPDKSKFKPIKMNNPNRPQELTDGLNKAKNGDLRGAIADFDLCIAKNPKNYNAYFYKAKALIELNEPQSALSNLNLAIETGPGNPMFFYYRGKIYFDMGNTKSAYDDFEKALTYKPDFADALNYRGILKEKAGKHAEAIDDYNAAIAANPEFALAYYNKGTSQAAMELYNDATLSFTKCVELDPKKVMGFMNRGNCYVMMKDYNAAISDYTTAITLDPGNSDAYYNRGAAYQLSGDKKSCNDWQKAQSLGNKKAAEMLKVYCK